MTTSAPASPASPFSPSGRAAIGAALITALAAGAMAMFDTTEMIGGGALERAAVPVRMLLLVAAATLLLRIAGTNWREVGLRSPGRPLTTVSLVIVGYLAIGTVYAILNAYLLPAMGLSPRTVEIFSGLRGDTGLYLFLLVAVAWGSAAFGEELVFRGFLQSRLELAFGSTRVSAALAALVQAIIFGALHSYQGAAGAITAGAIGLVMGIIYLAGRRNLWACILLHGLVDTVSLSAIYLGAVTA